MTAIEMKIVSRWVDGMGGTMLLADSRKNMFALENFVEQVRGRNLRVPAS